MIMAVVVEGWVGMEAAIAANMSSFGKPRKVVPSKATIKLASGRVDAVSGTVLEADGVLMVMS